MSSIPNLSAAAGLATQPLLGPVVALNIWTLFMEGWMYATRLPAMEKAKFKVSPSITAKDFDAQLPPHVQWKAHNYNHLSEQPTQFYAIALVLAILNVRDSTTTKLAWTYVGLRVVHSLVQATVNHIPTRFSLFAASSLTLLGITGRAALEVFSSA